ncbi:hypothetical protein pb186bvf_016174 [Paramecium bursaria]
MITRKPKRSLIDLNHQLERLNKYLSKIVIFFLFYTIKFKIQILTYK